MEVETKNSKYDESTVFITIDDELDIKVIKTSNYYGTVYKVQCLNSPCMLIQAEVIEEDEFEEKEIEDIYTFEDDMDKITDLMQAIINSKQLEENKLTFITEGCKEFHKSYSYLTKEEVQATTEKMLSFKSEELADLYRQAENLHIEDMNGRDTGYNVTGEQAKDIINEFAKLILVPWRYEEFLSILNSMGC